MKEFPDRPIMGTSKLFDLMIENRKCFYSSLT